MKRVELSQGKFAVVDDADWELVSSRRWAAVQGRSGIWYAMGREGGRGTPQQGMHRLIMGVTDRRVLVDHVDGDGLNNVRSNLRLATQRQNMQNKRGWGRSQYKGISWMSSRGKWYARIKVNGKLKHLGVFDDEVEAAKAYDVAAVAEFGEFARLNFPGKLGGEP